MHEALPVALHRVCDGWQYCRQQSCSVTSVLRGRFLGAPGSLGSLPLASQVEVKSPNRRHRVSALPFDKDSTLLHGPHRGIAAAGGKLDADHRSLCESGTGVEGPVRMARVAGLHVPRVYGVSG